MQHPPSTSSVATEDRDSSSPRPEKIRRLDKNGTGPSSASGRLRRAAQACELCRASKLRCEAPDPSSQEKRCVRCARMGTICEFTNPNFPRVSFNLNPGVSGVSSGGDSLQTAGERRLSQLESNVAKLLELVERSAAPSDAGATQNSGHAMIAPPQSHNNPFTPLNNVHNQPSSSLATLASFALSDQHLVADDTDFVSWLPMGDTPGRTSANISSGMSSALGPISANGVMGTGYDVGADALRYPAHLPPSHQPEQFPGTGLSTSPNVASDKSQKSHTSPPDSASERYTPAQARPIPKFGTASRFAAFTDPSSHEAPFRSLTYNPDTFRNVELSGEPSADDGGGTMKDSIPRFENGGKTPKRGQGDPIDRGIFSEEEARGLFNFFRNEISFFLPIFQEPFTFDAVRHHSSFLLSVILALASKYSCSAATREFSTPLDPFAIPPSSGAQTHVRFKSNLVTEEQWLQIRAIAMSSYFQALISKVHCLEDVQATLLLSAWGLQDRGASPDPWLLTGSAYRLAKRLGIHLAASTLSSGSVKPTAKLVASWKTYLCLYAFDRFLTVGFGRPETEGFEPSSVDATLLLAYLRANESDVPSNMGLFCSTESAACIAAYVELANIARDYSRFVNVTLKAKPSACLGEIRNISASLDAFSSQWLWARSPLAVKLGISARPVKMLYNHMRLCLHAVPLKPSSHPDSDRFLQRAELGGIEGINVLAQCLKKAEDSAVGIIQAFADDLRDDYDTVLCYAYDYAYMMLAHAAAVLLGLSTSRVSGLVDNGLNQSDGLLNTLRPPRDGGMDRVTATRYCGTAITALVDSNRSANFFPCDMALNLSLIAKEMGMVVGDWTSEKVIKMLEARATPPEKDIAPFPTADINSMGLPLDFGLFSDLDMFLPSGFFDDSTLFGAEG